VDAVPDWHKRALPRSAGFAVAAAAGAGLALGIAAAVGGLSRSTTTIREIQTSDSTPAPVSTFSAGRVLSVNEVYRRSAPGVVQITATSVVAVPADPFDLSPFQQRERRQALGSGFVIDKAGYIVTNYHVVQGAQNVEVGFSNKQSFKARVVGADASTDIALLKVNANSRALTPLPLGDSDGVRVGDQVVAIGNPFGLERSVTAGIVSALQRQIVSPNFLTIDHVIQTDASINRGNSGGPLIDARGRVIGVNSQIETGDAGGQGNVGIGFAVPINTVKEVVAQLKQHGRVERAYIGISVHPITAELARVFRLPVERGLLIERVEAGSGAAEAGLRGGTTQIVLSGESYVLGGDVVVEADGAALDSLDDLRHVLAAKRPGTTVKLVVHRGAKQMTMKVTLGRQPPTPSG
jgi:S1-C subfamily serine protease